MHRSNPYIPIPIPPPCLLAASPCIFSLTLILTSKNLPTHRSRHTDSPLFRSPSRYSPGIHFLEQDSVNLVRLLAIHRPHFSIWLALSSAPCHRASIPGEHIRDHLDFCLSGSNFLCRGHLGRTTKEEGHFDRAV